MSDVVMSDGAERLNLSTHKALEPDGDGHLWRVKYVFTTISGSWEVSDHPYSVPQWARDLYLKGPYAPDYFDDAGGERHLFVRAEWRGPMCMSSAGAALHLARPCCWQD